MLHQRQKIYNRIFIFYGFESRNNFLKDMCNAQHDQFQYLTVTQRFEHWYLLDHIL